MTSTDLAVEVHGLRKYYGDKKAVDGIDLTIARGEVFAVLGPNGAGKTTTVEILEGHRMRDSGDVRVLGEDPGTAGRDCAAASASSCKVLWTRQKSLQVEAVRHFASYYANPLDPAEVIELCGLTEKANTRLRKLSGGQRRRLDVALGIVGRPELLFLDEPTTGFDPQARRDFWELIESLRHNGTTILLTTHYLDEAEHLADRLAVINSGRVQAVSTPTDLGGRTARRAVVHWTEDGVARQEATDYPTQVVAELAAHFAPAEIPALQVIRPSLEDIYLSMIATPAA